MKTKTNSSRFKFSAAFLFGTFAFVLIANAGSISIPASFSNVVQVIQRLFITDDGSETGNPVMDINTGGSVVVYVPLVDGAGNAYLTGTAGLLEESDPIWNAVSGDYMTTTQLGAAGYITGESDPLFLASTAATITTENISYRNTAYSRGDRRGQ
jgi:hypothetical protein